MARVGLTCGARLWRAREPEVAHDRTFFQRGPPFGGRDVVSHGTLSCLGRDEVFWPKCHVSLAPLGQERIDRRTRHQAARTNLDRVRWTRQVRPPRDCRLGCVARHPRSTRRLVIMSSRSTPRPAMSRSASPTTTPSSHAATAEKRAYPGGPSRVRRTCRTRGAGGLVVWPALL